MVMVMRSLMVMVMSDDEYGQSVWAGGVVPPPPPRM